MIDSDVHHTWSGQADVVEYLPRRWREYAQGRGQASLSIEPATVTLPHVHGPNKRLDTYPPGGGPPGSDFATLERQLLAPFNIRRAILSFDVGGNGGLSNVDFAVEVVRAANRWNVEHWLSRDDDRIRSVVLVPTQSPEVAVAEVRDIGRHPKVAEVLMVANGLRRPFGDPLYHPIYEAAAELGLPVGVHLFGGDGSQAISAAGFGASRLEFHTVLPQLAQHNLLSFIVHGAFEKYPELRVLMIEQGVVWLPWLLWSLDSHYDVLRMESPWVRRRPSEYVREHVLLTTQPLEVPAESGRLAEALSAYEGIEDLLCFSTDYPHWDTDDPTYIARHLPADWLPKVFYENARHFYRWTDLPAAGTPAGTHAEAGR